MICEECAVTKIVKCDDWSHAEPWGGIIGPGKTLRMQFLFSSLSPLFKSDAVFHDAYGHRYWIRRRDPGYIYEINFPRLPKNFWLGHITGLFFFFLLRITNLQPFRYFVYASDLRQEQPSHFSQSFPPYKMTASLLLSDSLRINFEFPQTVPAPENQFWQTTQRLSYPRVFLVPGVRKYSSRIGLQ